METKLWTGASQHQDSKYVMRFLIFFVAILIVWPFFARAQALDHSFQTEISSLLNEVFGESDFSPLQIADIKIESLESTDTFLQALPMGRLQVNPRLFLNPPSREALKAILAHELFHLHDYVRMSKIEFARFGLKYLLNSPQGFVASYERLTDERAICRGYGPGLKLYRNWLYQNVSLASLATKRANYYTPEEIEKYIEGLRCSVISRND